MTRAVHVTILLGMRTHYGRQLLVGISRYASGQANWDLFVHNSFLGPDMPPHRHREDGIIACITNREQFQQLPRRRIPVVNVSWTYEVDRLPTVVSDNRLVGRMAAEHLLSRGFRSLAYGGDSDFAYSRLRWDGFAEAAKQAGLACRKNDQPRGRVGRPWDNWRRTMGRWVTELPKPVGLMAFTDAHAWRIYDVCRKSGLAIPQDVAIVGVNNDSLIANMCRPPLSSVVLGAAKIGYRAAALLDRMMQGHSAPQEPVLLPPVGVVTRQSSDILAVADPLVSKALKLIRRQSGSPLTVEEILDELLVSRRSLERRFLKHLGRSPHEVIVQAKIDQARRLLADTPLPICQVASSSGFGSVKHFYRVFKQQAGISPGCYRGQCRCVSDRLAT